MGKSNTVKKRTNKKRRLNKFYVCIILLLVVVLFSAVRIITLNSQWPQAQDIITERGQALERLGAEILVVDSVIGSPKETLTHYGAPNTDIPSNEILFAENDGWTGYVLAVKLRITNVSSEDISIYGILTSFVEAGSWHNGSNVYANQYINTTTLPEVIKVGESYEIIMCFDVYKEHFQEKDWNELESKNFYLAFEPFYPEKQLLDCTPAFL